MEKEVKKGYVYLLGDWEKEGIFKIGVTKGAIEHRIKKLQTGNAGEIYIVAFYHTEHPFFLEKQLHFKFQGKRVMNEWFQLSNEEILDFKKTCQEVENMIEDLKDNPFFPKKLK